MKKLKVGLTGLMQLNFRGDKLGQYRRSVNELKQLSGELDFDFYALENGIVTVDDAKAAVKEIQEQSMDFLLIQNSSFASGYLVQYLARTNTYIGLWGVPEPTEEGPLPLNSFCGVNLNASIIGEYLKEYDIPFKWFYGNVYDELFLERFRITIKVLTSIVNLRNSKIGLIGGIAPGFDNFYHDERLLEKRFGTRVNRLHEFGEIKNRALSYRPEELRETVGSIRKDAADIAPKAEEALEMHARVFKAFRDFSEENGYDALAVSCWPKFRAELGMVPCAAFGRLNDEGIVTACEGDVYSALSMLALKYMAKYPPILMDLSGFDEKDDTVFLWHCGVGSSYYAKNEEIFLEPHFNPGPYSQDNGWQIMGPVSSMVFAPMEATVMRFTREGAGMLVMSGAFRDDGKKSHDGSRGWFGDLKLNGEDAGARDVVNTIIVNRFQHHYPLVKGNFTEELMEFAAWLGINPLEKVNYKNYLQITK